MHKLDRHDRRAAALEGGHQIQHQLGHAHRAPAHVANEQVERIGIELHLRCVFAEHRERPVRSQRRMQLCRINRGDPKASLQQERRPAARSSADIERIPKFLIMEAEFPLRLQQLEFGARNLPSSRWKRTAPPGQSDSISAGVPIPTYSVLRDAYIATSISACFCSSSQSPSDSTASTTALVSAAEYG